jgi:hypothetical protein
VLDRRAHGDDALRPRHLHLEVGVVRDRHELGIARTPKDGVVRSPEPHHLEGEGFLAEIVRRAEPDWQINLPEGWTRLPSATSWNDVVLGRSWYNTIPISRRVCAYKMLRLLPPSISTLENRELPMTGSTTSEYCPGQGMRFG